jgi:hypothetical protein
MRALCLAIVVALAASSGAEARGYCARGYHADRRGDCQPNIRQTNRYCPRGTVYQPAPDGWRCVPGRY